MNRNKDEIFNNIGCSLIGMMIGFVLSVFLLGNILDDILYDANFNNREQLIELDSVKTENEKLRKVIIDGIINIEID